MNDISNITVDGDAVFSVDMLNPNSPLPLYYQIFENLSRRIHAGELPNGYKLPSEMNLASRLGVSRITIKRALNELASSGLVSRKRGRGTQVTLNTALVIKGGVTDMKSNIVAIRKTTQATLIERRKTDVPEAVRNTLNFSADDDIEMIRHALVLGDGPVTLSTSYAAANIFESFTDEDVEQESLIILMERQGIRISQADQTLSAIAATDEQAKIFDIKPGSPLLEIQCLMRDQRGKPCHFVVSCFQPEFYRYEMILK